MTSAGQQNTSYSIPGGIPLLATVLPGAGLSIVQAIRNPNIGGSDGMSYLLPIHNAVAGHGYTIHPSQGAPELLFPPGYGLFAYLFFLIIRDIEFAGMAASIIAYSFTIVLSFFVGKLIHSRQAGHIAALLVSCSSLFLSISYINLSETTFILFMTIALCLLLKITLQGGSILNYALFGFIIGYCCLIRPEAQITASIAFLLVPAIFICNMRQKKTDTKRNSDWRRFMILYGVALVCCFICVFPYMHFLYQHTGKWTLSTKSTYNIIVGEQVVLANGRVQPTEHFEHMRSAHPELFTTSAPLDINTYVQSRGIDFITMRLLFNVREEIILLVAALWHVLLALGGAWLISVVFTRRVVPQLTHSRSIITTSLCFCAFVAPLVFFPIFFLDLRFVLPYAIFLMILIATVIVSLVKQTLKHLNRNNMLNLSLVTICSIAALSLSGLAPVPLIPSLHSMITTRDDYLGLRAAGLWLHKNVQMNSTARVFTCRGGNIPPGAVVLFYASGKAPAFKGQPVTLPASTTVQSLTRIATAPSDYVIWDNYYCPSAYEQLTPLWTDVEQTIQHGLELMHRDNWGRFVIYRPAPWAIRNEVQPSMRDSWYRGL